VRYVKPGVRVARLATLNDRPRRVSQPMELLRQMSTTWDGTGMSTRRRRGVSKVYGLSEFLPNEQDLEQGEWSYTAFRRRPKPNASNHLP
jgi:hypothetical protein